jgi:hypothetical protein
MDRKPVAYLAGPFSGRCRSHTVARFATYQTWLEYGGRQVVNPTVVVPPSASWWCAMVRCLWVLRLCDELWLLPDWQASRGARLEYRAARVFGLRVYVCPVLY